MKALIAVTLMIMYSATLQLAHCQFSSPATLSLFVSGAGFSPYTSILFPHTATSGDLKVDDMYGMVNTKGYSLTEFPVKTSDGYTLRTYRIQYGRDGAPKDTTKIRPPVLLLHGISLSSTSFVVNQPTESLAFILADAGYDVWMMNQRGNTFARKQDMYSDTNPEFWKFSLDEYMKIDLPNTVDYILSTTGFKQLAGLVGHSQGSAVIFGALALDPSLGYKVGLVLALAPSVYVKFATTPILSAFSSIAPPAISKLTTDVVSGVDPSEFIPFDHQIQSTIASGACQSILLTSKCVAVIEAAFGRSIFISTPQYRRYMQQWPSSTSTWNPVHWAQIFNSPTPSFKLFNQGAELDLTKIKARVILVTGTRDEISAAKDNELVKQRLTEGGSFQEQIIIPDYAHMDFIWDTGAGTKVFPLVVDRLNTATKAAHPDFL